MVESGRIYRFLVIDDDEVDRRHYTRLLARYAPDSCIIEQAGDGATGLIMLHAQAFDCVLLDFNLPDMNGLEFVTRTMTDREHPCAIVLITGQGNAAIAVEAMKLGVEDYLVKSSLAEGKLWDTVVGAMDHRELRRYLDASQHDLRVANVALESEVAIRRATEVKLRTAKEAAEEASQAKTRFIAMITHELRTPLNGILGYAQLLLMNGSLSDQQSTQVTAMMKAGRHLYEMIEHVLDFASIEAGRMEIHPALVSVHDLTEGCISFIGPMVTERGLGLRVVNSHDAPTKISTDPARLRQVLLNLLGNAVKFTREGSVELRILPAATKGNLRLEVADTGPGIDEAYRKHLFQDFERCDAGISVEGAGLGLAISARIIGLMGGTIGHEPGANGGSVFWLELPDGDLDIPSPLSATPAALSAMPERIRALLVDDIAMNRDVIGAFLRNSGHDIHLAENGRDAVRFASEQIFDVILMDVRMPEMDGLQATRLIRKLPGSHANVPILALTAYSFPEQVAECRAAGMDGHVSKPVDYILMLRAITDAITRSSASRRQDYWAPGQPSPEKQPPLRLDWSRLNQIFAAATPERVDKHFLELRRLMEEMLRFVDERAAPAKLTKALHGMVSAAGMFGFMALSTVARYLEHAVASEAPEGEQLAQNMREELRAALELLDELIHENRKQPA